MTIHYIGIFIAVVSFLGFMVENTWLTLTKGYMDNRNMNLPFLLGYGLAVTAFGVLFGTPDNMWLLGTELGLEPKWSRLLYFGVAFAAVCLGEHTLGTLVEKICGFEYWNYEWMPLHFSKYTALPTSMAFAFAMTFFMDVLLPVITEGLQQLNANFALCIGTVLFVLLAVDFVCSFRYMYQNRRLYEKRRLYLRRGKPVLETIS